MKATLIPTDDNWHGNFEGEKVKLSLVDRGSCFAVIASGTDDLMIEKEFSSFSLAFGVHKALSNKNKLNKDDLFKLGFECG